MSHYRAVSKASQGRAALPLSTMADLTKNQKRDYQVYLVEGGDPGFSPAKNKAVIDGTIEKYEARRKAKIKEYQKNVGERAEAVAFYLKHVNSGKFTPVEKYFSRRELARLRGEKILQTLKGNYIELSEV